MNEKPGSEFNDKEGTSVIYSDVFFDVNVNERWIRYGDDQFERVHSIQYLSFQRLLSFLQSLDLGFGVVKRCVLERRFGFVNTCYREANK